MTDTTEMKHAPEPLREFLASGKSVFRCDDGDWDVLLEHPTPKFLEKALPENSLVIANNGCGDYLFLQSEASQESGAPEYGPKVFVWYHEESLIETFAKNLAELTHPPEPAPSDHGLIYYADGVTRALIGDHVSARSVLFRKEARVVYVPGITKRNREFESGGLAWVGIRFEDGGVTAVVVDPETSRLKKGVGFVSRATTPVEELDPYFDFE